MWRVASSIVLVLHMATVSVFAQLNPDIRLSGQAFLSDDVMTNGVAVLHHLIGGEQGGLDSVPIMEDGTFHFYLPNHPSSDGRDIYFSSIRHQGVLYFGPPITEPEKSKSTLIDFVAII